MTSYTREQVSRQKGYWARFAEAYFNHSPGLVEVIVDARPFSAFCQAEGYVRSANVSRRLYVRPSTRFRSRQERWVKTQAEVVTTAVLQRMGVAA